MRNYVVQYQQSLLDVALQECGDVSAVVDIARLNNISVTEDLEAGQVLFLPEAVKPEVVRYYKQRGIVLATDIPRPNRSQTISFEPIPSLNVGDSVFLVAVASSGLPVTFASTNPSVAVVVNNTLTIVGTGTATIIATQAGNSVWRPASASQTIVISEPVVTGAFSTAFSEAFN
ncbi:hypothetical protein [Raineya sp.]